MRVVRIPKLSVLLADWPEPWRGWRWLVVAAAVSLTAIGLWAAGDGVGVRLSIFGLLLLLAATVVPWWPKQQIERRIATTAAPPPASSIRDTWEACVDCDGVGWARTDLEALRLLCLNLDRTHPLGARLAERWRKATSHLLSSSLDRLLVIAVQGRSVGLDPERIARLERAAETLFAALDGVAFAAGSIVPFDPADLADACDSALENAAALRVELEPRVRASLHHAVLEALATLDATSARSRIRWIPCDERTASLSIAVEPSDLESTVTRFIARLAHSARATEPIQLSLEIEEEELRMIARWRADDRLRLAPADLVQPLGELRPYRVRHFIREHPEQLELELSAWFPAAVP